MTRQQIAAMDTPTLQVIVRSASRSGQVYVELYWAIDELARRAVGVMR